MKRLAKKIALAIGCLLRRDASSKVVFYHDIGRRYTSMGTSEEVFEAHMGLIRAGDIVCFDDGFMGVYEHRHLLPRGVKVFVAPRLVGSPGYMGWNELRELQKDFGVDVECHTWTHQTLAGPMIDESPVEGRTEAWFRRELVESKSKIEFELGKEVGELCFPVGYYSAHVIERCRDAGYGKLYASFPGNVCDDYVQPRCIVQDLTPKEFSWILCGGMNWLEGRYLARHFVEE